MFELFYIFDILAAGGVAAVGVVVAIGAFFAGGYFLQQALQPKSPKQYPFPDVGGYPLQTSAQGPPIIKVYGTTVVAGNVMWQGPSIPYNVRVGVSGGKHSNEHRNIHYQTAYKKSFLLGVCEGPASVVKITKGKEEVPLSDFTIFPGVDNSGITALTGEDYGEYPNMCCIFADEYELGGGDALPQFKIEVSSGQGPYFAGLYWGAAPSDIVVKVGADNAIDTSWGTSGKWQYDSGFGATAYCTALYQMPDGRLLVAHNYIWVDGANVAAGGSLVNCTMLTAAGAIDTSWGYNGHYVIKNAAEDRAGMEPVTRLLRDDEGNFHLFTHGVAGSPYNYHIFDEDGTRLYAYDYQAGGGSFRHPQTIHDATFNADNSRIIAVGTDGLTPGTADPFNAVAFLPADGSIDTTWAGNTGVAGYALVGTTGLAGQDANAIVCVDGGYIIHFDASANSSFSLTKWLLDGSGRDRTWGAGGGGTFPDGYVMAGDPIYGTWGGGHSGIIKDGNNVWTLCAYHFAGVADTKRQMLRCWDANGTPVVSHDFTAPVQTHNYHCMGMVSGGLVFGTYWMTPANYQIERWVRNMEYLDGVTVTSPSRPAVSVIQGVSKYDMNPADIIRDLREHDRYGAGLPAARTDDVSFAACGTYWESQGLLISIAVNEQKPLDDWIDEVLKHCFGFRFRSNGKFKLGALRDQSPVFTITQDDLWVEKTDDPPPPVAIVKRPYMSTFNNIKVMWTDRANRYRREPARAKDVVDIRISKVRSRMIEAIGIMDPDIAQMVVERFRFEGMYRFSLYNFSVGFKHMLIEPGDVGTLSDGGQLTSQRIRILTIEEDKDGRRLNIQAMDDTSEHYPDWRALDYRTQPALIPAPSPVTLADATVNFREDIDSAAIYLSIAPGSANATGWDVYVSYDDLTYEFADHAPIHGVTDGDANSVGTIQSNLPAHPAVVHRQGESFLVDIGTVTDLETTISDENFFAGRKLAKIGNEIIAYRDCVESSTPGVWQVTNLIRGMFGTEAAVHSSGETFATLDIDFPFPFRDVDIGQTLYFKVLTYYGADIQDISLISSFSVTVQGYHQRPGPASLIRLSADENDIGSLAYSGASFTLYWNRPGARGSGYGAGGYDVNPAWPIWRWGDSEGYLTDGGGVPFDNYLADLELQAIVLQFEQEDGTPIGQRQIAVGESTTITKATDLGGYNPARIKVIPRRSMQAWKENSILVDDGS